MNSPIPRFALGLDFGTNTVRALIADTADGREIATAEAPYAHGDQGIITDESQPELARQHPSDYLEGAAQATQAALTLAKESNDSAFSIVGIGIDATGSTPMPIDAKGQSICDQTQFQDNPNAMAWLWKDHTSIAEAAELTSAAQSQAPQYLEKCGGTYSSEWFWAKLLHCARTAPEVISQTHSWIEIADWIPAVLTGNEAQPNRGICQAGHKGWYHQEWGGYPSAEFLSQFDPNLARIRETLPDKTYPIDQPAGTLTEEWALRLGLEPGTPVAVGALDAHLGVVGCGIATNTLVKILGTSTCDIIVSPMTTQLPFIPGLCGIAPHSVIPNHFGLEAGQSAVGDIFNWWVDVIQPGQSPSHEDLTALAQQQSPGESGLLSLDWNNGNRTVLVDPQLSGLILGQTLQTQAHEIYRALLEATAYGARVIMERIEEYGIPITEVIACGGIAEKNEFLMQLYADVTGRTMKTSRSAQTCALGAAICGAVVGGAHEDIPTAQTNMTGTKERIFRPQEAAAATYNDLFGLYRELHDAFGKRETSANLFPIMKTLIEIRQRARAGQS
ncbi:ribulokinase [bacterium]|nr:ribulokinase [bacterium]